MTTQQIVSQIINFFGSTTNMVGICIKNKRKTLILFTIGNSLIAIALGLLGATAGMIVEICFVIESLINFFLEKKYTLYPIWLIFVYVVVPVTILIIMFQSSWDLLPIVASVLFALSMVFHNFSLRLLNFLSVVLWIPYNIVYVQYVGAVSCGVLAIINLIAIIRYDILKKKEEIMETLKAGCFLINKENKSVALVYRVKQNDYSFPKGHLEEGETLEECAIRETAEETKRIAKIVKDFEPYVEKYTTPKGEQCACYMFIALDNGKSDNTSEDTHDTYWIPFEQVEDKLSYPNLKKTWNEVKDKIKKIL